MGNYPGDSCLSDSGLVRIENLGDGYSCSAAWERFYSAFADLSRKAQPADFFGKAIALAGIALVAISVLLRETSLLLYYPVAVNLLLFILFFSSLRARQSIVERLARLSEPYLPPAGVSYTRRVTQVWCIFFVFNGSLALYTCLNGDVGLWALYNGGISYLLIGLLMGIEWTVRKRLQRS